MKKRIWNPWTHRMGITVGMNGKYTYMSGSEAHISYVWEGKLANIHGTTTLIRRLLWNSIKTWLRFRLQDGSIHIWFMVTLCIMVLIGSVVAVMKAEGML